MNTLKKIFSVFLLFSFLLELIPVSAYADNNSCAALDAAATEAAIFAANSMKDAADAKQAEDKAKVKAEIAAADENLAKWEMIYAANATVAGNAAVALAIGAAAVAVGAVATSLSAKVAAFIALSTAEKLYTLGLITNAALQNARDRAGMSQVALAVAKEKAIELKNKVVELKDKLSQLDEKAFSTMYAYSAAKEAAKEASAAVIDATTKATETAKVAVDAAAKSAAAAAAAAACHASGGCGG
ncbi:hypothetical protein [Chlorobium phaeobacteroides]|uniref:Mucin-associated surface protein (MASP) n=1 Tax=Chlorobium phaeobacteroides (strain DSM 266 / SMG 266 / 2430) TaxID=290317 RepID=A1BJD7_CHLPD|nr:hypothetical protein [Chlorobium phaeobacteroides]ABL66514.1 mucin-associated surface protein (MASP) [Chlorobium phaeobacteroides DSM 266]